MYGVCMDPTSDAELAGGVVRLGRAVQAAHERCARDHDVSPTLARLLGALSNSAPTMNELAAQLGLDKSSTSGLVDRADRRGLVRRVASQVDRRSVRVRLTAEGRALHQRLSACLETDLDAMLEPLTDEQRGALAGVLRAILAPR